MVAGLIGLGTPFSLKPLTPIWGEIVHRIVLLFPLILLAGCKTPAVTAYSPDAVTLKYDPAFFSLEDVSQTAAELCGRYGKKAKLSHDAAPALLSNRYASFNCID